MSQHRAQKDRRDGQPLQAKAEKRRSNLVDDLLCSNSDNDIESDIDSEPSARKPSPPHSARHGFLGSQASSRNSHTASLLPQSTGDAVLHDRRSYKRARLERASVKKVSSLDVGTGSRSNLTFPTPPVATPPEIAHKRRGRPPGSRNKNKLVTGLPPARTLIKEPSTSDASNYALHQYPLTHYTRSTQTLCLPAILRHRELGGYLGLNLRNLQDGLRQTIVNGLLSPWKSWEGASKDVVTATWSPDGTHFAVGASTDLDTLNLRYNRSNNLLWGDTQRGYLSELADHHLSRDVSTATEGSFQNDGAYNTLDPRVFTTVSSICFNARGDQMYTSSYDRNVKIWDASDSDVSPRCVSTLVHETRVELLHGREEMYGHLLATAQWDSKRSISVFGIKTDEPESNFVRTHFTSERAERMGFFPTALRWGRIPSWTEQLLLAGFAGNKNDERDRDRQGDLLLWDIIQMAPSTKLAPAAQCVFDLTWHPRLPLMAAATTPGPLLGNKRMKSVIRTWSPLETGSRIMEFECPALDVNEICFHPSDQNYICAACTDGCAYVWDVRRPNDILQVLQHDKGIEEIDHSRSREDQDTGMRFMSWNLTGSFLYTGSSDGIIKQWNPLLAREDALIKDVAAFDSGVMAASFSPDFSNLLVGLCKGSVQLLSSAPPSDPCDVVSQSSLRPSQPERSLTEG